MQVVINALQRKKISILINTHNNNNNKILQNCEHLFKK